MGVLDTPPLTVLNVVSVDVMSIELGPSEELRRGVKEEVGVLDFQSLTVCAVSAWT